MTDFDYIVEVEESFRHWRIYGRYHLYSEARKQSILVPGNARVRIRKVPAVGKPDDMDGRVPMEYVLRVRQTVSALEPTLIKAAQYALEQHQLKVKVLAVRLIGSYSERPTVRNTATRRPRENSDIDVAVYYRGAVPPEAVAEALKGRLEAEDLGMFDVVPILIRPGNVVPSERYLKGRNQQG